MAASTEAELIRKDGGQGSSSCSNYPTGFIWDREVLSVVVDNDAGAEITNEWLWNDGNEVPAGDGVKKNKMEAVPPMLREVEFNKDCFDPVMVSIGPYHHGKPRLRAAEKFKSSLTKMFFEKCPPKPGSRKLLRDAYMAAFEAQEYYDEATVRCIDSKTFAQMMLRDGCFILQFMDCLVNNNLSELKAKSHEIAFMHRDLFRLENQLPFQVLQALIYLRFNTYEDGLCTINKFMKRTMALPPIEDQATGSDDHQQPIHLLDLLWKQLIGINELKRERGTGNKNKDWHSFRSAKELKTAGIHFRRSKSNRFTDVEYKFELVRATLRLPPMTVDDSTKSLLLNLVAYEMCPNGPEVSGVASYLCLIDSLIDKAEDVQELRRKGILLNFLGNDEQVADLFNQITYGLVPDPYAYSDVKNKIESHHKNKILVWTTEWLNTHFSSPWTVLAFVGAILALALSWVQTYYTLHPKND